MGCDIHCVLDYEHKIGDHRWVSCHANYDHAFTRDYLLFGLLTNGQVRVDEAAGYAPDPRGFPPTLSYVGFDRFAMHVVKQRVPDELEEMAKWLDTLVANAPEETLKFGKTVADHLRSGDYWPIYGWSGEGSPVCFLDDAVRYAERYRCEWVLESGGSKEETRGAVIAYDPEKHGALVDGKYPKNIGGGHPEHIFWRIRDPDIHSLSYLDLEECRKVQAAYAQVADNVGYVGRTRNVQFDAIVAAMEALEYGGEYKARFVFGFDN